MREEHVRQILLRSNEEGEQVMQIVSFYVGFTQSSQLAMREKQETQELLTKMEFHPQTGKQV